LIDLLMNNFLVGFFAGKKLGILAVYLGLLWYISANTRGILKISRLRFVINLLVMWPMSMFGAKQGLGLLLFANPKTYATFSALGTFGYAMIPASLALCLAGLFQLFTCYKYIQQKFSSTRRFLLGFWIQIGLLSAGILLGAWRDSMTTSTSLVVPIIITAVLTALLIKGFRVMSRFYAKLASDLSEHHAKVPG